MLRSIRQVWQITKRIQTPNKILICLLSISWIACNGFVLPSGPILNNGTCRPVYEIQLNNYKTKSSIISVLNNATIKSTNYYPDS